MGRVTSGWHWGSCSTCGGREPHAESDASLALGIMFHLSGNCGVQEIQGEGFMQGMQGAYFWALFNAGKVYSGRVGCLFS